MGSTVGRDGVATELRTALGEAALGLVDADTIDSILTTGTFTEDHLSELQSALVAGNLENIYVLG